MEVCEVCGAFLIVGDAQSRVDDHLMGKQHMGYAKIKATVEELKVGSAYLSLSCTECINTVICIKNMVMGTHHVISVFLREISSSKQSLINHRTIGP